MPPARRSTNVPRLRRRVTNRVARNLYITAMEPQSGKSIVALGVMELLSARVAAARVLPARSCRRRTEPDPQIELIRSRYRLSASRTRRCTRSRRRRRARCRRLRGAAGACGRGLQGARAHVRLRRLRGDRLRGRRSRARLRPQRRPRERARRAGARRRQGRRPRGDGRVGAGRERVARAQGLHDLRRASSTGFRRTSRTSVQPALSSRAGGGAEPVYVLPEGRSSPIPTVAEVAAQLGAEILLRAGARRSIARCATCGSPR